MSHSTQTQTQTRSLFDLMEPPPVPAKPQPTVVRIAPPALATVAQPSVPRTILRTSPWTRLGRMLDPTPDAATALRSAGLNWSVTKTALRTADLAPVPDHYAITRSDQHAIYGILVHATHAELQRLYTMDGVGVFLPEAVVVVTQTGMSGHGGQPQTALKAYRSDKVYCCCWMRFSRSVSCRS